MREERYRPASNGEGQVMTYSWKTNSPKGIVIFLHDQGNYATFYNSMAEYLNQNGYDVYAEDIAGHGMSKQGHPGSFGMKKGAFSAVIEDVHKLVRDAEKENESGLPKVLIGIGLGSVIAMSYTAKYGDVEALTLLSVPNSPKMAKFIRGVAKQHVRRNGYYSISESVASMITQLDSIPGNKEERRYFWFSSEESEVQTYNEDPDCGLLLSAGSYLELLDAYRKLKGKNGIAKIPDIPVLIMAGAEDQLGDCGETARKLDAMFTSETKHSRVDMKIYPDSYHDILHDCCKEKVLRDFVSWINRNVIEE